ncbi:hypothetical protein DNTS_023129 [Danionella cerebrum]|uniref:Uncharacterized protein n=1 Tax=Danionella cerebrum TaxID=2873325 RepID=A0A553PVW2_9TELE|nr:hypothetical protein DNTS_023129 [Danionella translucida]
MSGHGSGPGRKLKDSSVAFGGGGSSSLIQEIARAPPFTGPGPLSNNSSTQTVVTVWRTYACPDEAFTTKTFICFLTVFVHTLSL